MARFLHGGQPGHRGTGVGASAGADDLQSYLRELQSSLRLERNVEGEVVRELSAHLEDKLHDLEWEGMSPGEARRVAERSFGSPSLVARTIYEAHSQGTWHQTAMSVLPHLLFGLLFALNWWHNAFWLLFCLASILVFSAWGWLRGKPRWLFPWLGYLLVPVIAAGALLLYLPRAWSWVSVIAYVPFALWLILRVGRQSLAFDWLYCSLMVLPMPALVAWLLVLRQGSLLPQAPGLAAGSLAHWIALSFVVMGLGTALFIRLRRRWMKAGALLVSQVFVGMLVAAHASGLATWNWLLLAAVGLVCLAGPALLEGSLIRGKAFRQGWDVSGITLRLKGSRSES